MILAFGGSLGFPQGADFFPYPLAGEELEGLNESIKLQG